MYVITGGSSGIGRALALELARQQEQVLIIGRRGEWLKEVAAPPYIEYVCADITTPSGLVAIEEALAAHHSIKALVHNAGMIDPIKPLLELTPQEWEKIMATNLNAPLYLTQRLYPKLQQGRVLHIGSGVAHFPVKSWGGYCVSKAALYMLTRCWQLEADNVAFSSVMPGIIDTDMQGQIRQSSSMDEDKHDFFVMLKKEQRLLSPETVALFLAWLLKVPVASFVAKEWDIYDKSHHPFWLAEGHQVPDWEGKP